MCIQLIALLYVNVLYRIHYIKHSLSCLSTYFSDFILVILTLSLKKSNQNQVYGNSAAQHLKYLTVQNCIVKQQKKEMKGNSEKEKLFIGFKSEITF